ncbi:MAG: hypothetical protein LLG42_05115 [Chloroflexi bacterium]|nr:hypothetical protein [Chloroflexota bacterium]
MEEIDQSTVVKRIHKKQTLWQIWVPLTAGILIALFLCVMAVFLTTRDMSGEFNSKWAGVSVIFLSIPTLFAAFLFLVILVGLIYLASKLLHNAPVYGQKVIEFLQNVQAVTHNLSDKVAEPVINIKSKWHGFSTLFKKKSNRVRNFS